MNIYEFLQGIKRTEGEEDKLYTGKEVSGLPSRHAILVFNGEEFKIFPIQRERQWIELKQVIEVGKLKNKYIILMQVSPAIKERLAACESLSKEEKKDIKEAKVAQND